jgi:hypothetical protein
LVFSGDGVSPASTDARHLLASVLAYLEALAAVVGLAGEDVSDSLRLTLQEIRPGSVDYGCEAALPESSPYARNVRDVPPRLHAYLSSPHSAPRTIRTKVKNVIAATKRLGPDIDFVAKTDAAAYSISDAVRAGDQPTIWSLESLRARVVRVGGIDPRVQLECDSESKAISLGASFEKTLEIKNYLYRHVDVTAEIQRSALPPYSILNGSILTVIPLEDDVDAVDAWDRWYAAGGATWKGVANIEEALRGED